MNIDNLGLLVKQPSCFQRFFLFTPYSQKHYELFLKNRMLSLVEDLTNELIKLDADENSDQRVVEDIVLAKRLLRDSQRGLVTIQD